MYSVNPEYIFLFFFLRTPCPSPLVPGCPVLRTPVLRLYAPPAALEERNLRRYLLLPAEEDGASKILHLNIIGSFAHRFEFSQGAQAAGGREYEKDFWIRARIRLVHLFDVADMHVPGELHHLAQYAIRNGITEQWTYLLSSLGS